MTLGAPGGFIFSPTVLQVQNRILLGLVLVVVRRRVDERSAGSVGALRWEKNLLHAAVGNVFEGVEFPVVRRDFNAAFPADRSAEIQGSGIVECSSINREMIVVKAFIQRSCCCANPRAVIALFKLRASTAAQA